MLLCVLLCHLYVAVIRASVVNTEYGQVSGHYVNVDNGRDPLTPVEVFHGIPYADDTSGSRRFKVPEARTPWEGVLDATPLPPACPQAYDSWLQWTHPGWDHYSEDCLHLNIYTRNVSGGPYPVMVWLHGGSYQNGANFQYPGHFLASMDVTVVTVNYRMNVFGFTYCGNEACDSNVGLWDQQFALTWIVNNIANFGGDPGKITLFGESAGASCTAFQMLSPHSKDLFQQAILQSGNENNFWAASEEPESGLDRMARNLDCQRLDDTRSVMCMQQLPWEEVFYNGSCSMCVPVVDGPGGFLPEDPQELRRKGDIMTGPMMAGITKDEASLYLIELVPETIDGCCNRSDYEKVLRNRLVNIVLSGSDNVTKDEFYEALDYHYSPWPYVNDNYQNREALEMMMTDVQFGEGWDRVMKDHQRVAPTYGFLYNYRGRNNTQLYPEWMGVPHTGELGSVWGYPLLLLPTNEEVVQDSGIDYQYIYFTEEDRRHATYTMELWCNFAKYGNPTPQPVDDPLGGSTIWPEFTWDAMNVLEIRNTSIQVIREYQQKTYAFWTDYTPYIVGEDTLVALPPVSVLEEMLLDDL